MKNASLLMSINTIEKALNLASAGDDDEAISLLQPLAESGDIIAISNLGLILSYYNKNGKFTKIAEGAQLLKEACESGEGPACHNLAVLYLGNAPTLGKNLKMAAHLFLRARELSGPVADESFYNHWEEITHIK